jgi:hypothetical protein
MALNFGILQPVNIGGQIMAGQQETQRNQLAQQQFTANQQQMQTAAMQQEKAGMELSAFQRRQAGLKKFLDLSAKNGKTGSPEEQADSFYDFALTQEDPQLILAAQTMRQAAKERREYMASKQPPKIPPVGPAPGALGSGSFGMDQNTLGSGTFDFGQQIAPVLQPNVPNTAVSTPVRPIATPANQLAPMSMAAPANRLAPAPVNQPSVDTAALENRIIDLRNNYPNVPQAQAEAARLEKQLDEARKLYTVGGNLVTGTGKSVFTAPEKPPTQTELVRNYEYAKTPEGGNYKGTLGEFKAISTPKTTVTYGPQEKAEKVKYGEFLVKQFETVNEGARIASKSLPAIESNLATLDKGFDTGFGTETIAAGARVLGALGVQDAKDYATDAQTFLASANAAVLQRQLEQKGPQTESDAQRITATGAQLGNTKDANRFVLNVAKAQLQRDLEQRKFYSDWRTANKTLEGAEDAWFAGPGSKSLFDSPTLKKYSVNAVDQIPGQSRAAPAAAAIPKAAVDALKAGKGTDAQFDAIFGAGAAKRARGGK